MRAISGTVSVVLMLSLLSLSSTEAQDSGRTIAELSIREAVIRFQIKSWDLAANSYCVSLNNKDPDGEFLRRFYPLPVKSESACRKRTGPGAQMSVTDKATGKRSVIFDIGSIRWLGETDAEVDGGYLCGSLCMAAGTYHVVREEGRWVVTAFDRQAIS
jgi:hypothetical protein